MAKTSMYAIDRSEEYLAHYGIKGMKWGVRKAIEAGGTGLGNRKLARQYKKAQKKLAKLEKRANNGAKYARRAAALGAGAAAAGGLAALGTSGVAGAMDSARRLGGGAMKSVGGALSKSGNPRFRQLGTGMAHLGRNMRRNGGSTAASEALDSWGRSSTGFENAYSRAIRSHANRASNQAQQTIANGIKNNSIATATANKAALAAKAERLNNQADRARTFVNNNNIARAGAAALGAGLAGAAGYNAYRAATTKRAAKKADEFRREMNKTFAGTACGQKSGNKKRRRR